ncbi:MAG TPA: acyl-CoA dehydrogenase family protein [Rhizomicrobium sp.]|nr:acyl-CoA dehydrogenase family protein [Rhizomicrobium sp.]
MDVKLNATDGAFREEVRAFLRENLTAELRDSQLYSVGIYTPPSIWLTWYRKLAARGWAAPLWPKEFGGTGWTPIQRFIFDLECADAGSPVVYPMGVRLLGPVLIKFGSERQKAAFLPKILSGEHYWCQGYSEPNAGSDLTSLKTSAKLNGDEYVVNGSKIWTTHAHYANWIFMLVRTSTTGKRSGGITFLMVDLSSPGISIRPILSLNGERDLNQVFFEDVVVPVGNRVGDENRGWEYARSLLEFERGAAFYAPRMRAALARIQAVADSFAAAGRDPLNNPLIRLRLAEVSLEIDALEILEFRALASIAGEGQVGLISSVLKLQVSRTKQRIAEFGVSLLGSDALRWTLPADSGSMASTRSLQDTLLPDYLGSRAVTIYGGATEIQLGLIAKSLGL